VTVSPAINTMNIPSAVRSPSPATARRKSGRSPETLGSLDVTRRDYRPGAVEQPEGTDATRSVDPVAQHETRAVEIEATSRRPRGVEWKQHQAHDLQHESCQHARETAGGSIGFRPACDAEVMARSPRTLRVDLHGHDVVTALELSAIRVREAQANGWEAVELVHGAADVEEPVSEGRGRIKWELRRMAAGGRFDRWIDRTRTWEKAGSLVLYLKPNGRPGPARWSGEPSRRYRR
jgi:hypothetical protein